MHFLLSTKVMLHSPHSPNKAKHFFCNHYNRHQLYIKKNQLNNNKKKHSLCSKLAVFDGKKAIRGGIPLVFREFLLLPSKIKNRY